MRKLAVRYWPNNGNVWPMAVLDSAAPGTALLTPGVVSRVELASTSSAVGKTSLFMPAATLSGYISSGKTLAHGVVLSEGVVLGEAGTTNPRNAHELTVLGER